MGYNFSTRNEETNNDIARAIYENNQQMLILMNYRKMTIPIESAPGKKKSEIELQYNAEALKLLEDKDQHFIVDLGYDRNSDNPPSLEDCFVRVYKDKQDWKAIGINYNYVSLESLLFNIAPYNTTELDIFIKSI